MKTEEFVMTCDHPDCGKAITSEKVFLAIVSNKWFCSENCRSNWLKDNNLSILVKAAREIH